MGIRRDQQRLQQTHLRHQQQLAAQRPNEPPEDRSQIPAADRCVTSRTGRHDFSKFFNDDPKGSGLRSGRCWYCNRYSPRSQARIDAWRAQCDHKFVDSTHCLKCGWTP